ncbi:hypothetical protein [Mucilaginibacter dorajii]|uniref:DUF5689 domain-containing protein n=1 Tax=Mucilaginibacter dorajii TaxID=692994 RepID=A0ABP7RA23_9SPHI|nr:hypothetical protein [Mucilaginibacter dorajii]MCS3736755.1 hypothetical protein [Mucilaginibacter dorajii]
MSIIASFQYTNGYSTFPDQNGGEISYADVFIALTDSVTHQPVNGNNVVVTYTDDTETHQVTIPGQSIRILENATLQDNRYNELGEQTQSYYRVLAIVSVSGGGGAAPTPTVCDLKINFINIDKPESSVGAADAQVTINASSTYGPIQYSNDFGSTWQLSPTFSGLSGGLIQPVVKDANPLGCTQQEFITIPMLSDLLTSDPSVTLTGGNISRWNAAFNPIVFTYQRKDFGVTNVTVDTEKGYACVTVNTSLMSSITAKYLVASGEKVYLNAGVYKGVYEIDKLSGYNNIIIKTLFVGNATGFININSVRPYYKIITQITYLDKLTGVQNTIAASNRPDGTGLVKADLSNFLQSLLRPADNSGYTQANFRDDNLSASYQIQYAEHWDDGSTDGHTTTFINMPHPYYVVYAAKQLGDRYGGNLAAYVPFADVSDNSQLAKWVTDFAEPAYSIGYPFDIGFIYSDEIVGLQLYAETTLLDINRQPLAGGPQVSYLLNDDGSWLLNQDGSKFIIADQTQVNTSIPGQLGLNRLMISGSFPREAFYFNLALKYADEHGTHTVTQTQVVRIDDAVDDQSVYLRWIGLSGSWNYYRFVFNQEISLDVQNATIIKNFVNDWENQQGIEEVISKTAGQKMKVVAEDLSVADIKGLQSIKYSPKVQMLVNKNPVKWQTIVINTATFSEYETRNGQAPFSITFNMPSINIQTQ